MSEKHTNRPLSAWALDTKQRDILRDREQKESRERREKQTVFEEEKANILDEIATKKELTFLRSLIERGLIRPSVAREIIEHKTVQSEEIESLFEKIDAIDRMETIDKILPSEYRPTKEEYLLALQGWEDRARMLMKLNIALKYVNRGYGGGRKSNIFGNFLMFLSASLEIVQENLIDLRRGLSTTTEDETV